MAKANYFWLFARPILLAVSAGLLVTTIAWYTSWESDGRKAINSRLRHNRILLRGIEKAIENYRVAHGTLPNTLNDVFSNESSKDEVTEPRIDFWNKPLVYIRNDDDFELWSYGRDGVKGGTWYDCDITYEGPDENCQPTFKQFCKDPLTSGFRASYIIAGVLASICCFILVVRQKGSVVQLILPVIVTIVFSVIFACVLAFTHIPSGH